jgi:VWFA-related protein
MAVGLWAAARLVLATGVAGAAQTPTFRSGVDLIPVDVQIVDGDGHPVQGLSAAQFEVTVDGKKRKVVSADFIDLRTTTATVSGTPAPAAPAPVAPAAPLATPRRIVVLAIDANSLSSDVAKPILDSAAAFVRKLPADDEVGLFTFPNGPKIDPTTDHDAIVRAFAKLALVRDKPMEGLFNLSASDVVELSTWLDHHATPQAAALAKQLCDAYGPGCTLDDEERGHIYDYEAMAQVASGTLRALIAELGKVPFRKTVVLVSGGFVTSDLPGARPDIQTPAAVVGKLAAANDVNVYTLFVDPSLFKFTSAETRRVPNTITDVGRDGRLYSRWLDEFSGRAGGSLTRVTAGDGHVVFDRILSETSAYYLLGVESIASDHDGRAHELNVRVSGQKVTVRGRAWVVVPKPGATALVSPAPVTIAASATAQPALPVAPAVRTLAGAFDRDDRETITTTLTGPAGESVLKAFRDGGDPFPGAPKRTAVLALDLAMAGLASDSTYTRDEAMRTIVEYAIRVRQPAVDDPFECAWLRVATAGLEGHFDPGVSTAFVDRAVERCPGDPRIRLGAAIVKDQWLWLNDAGAAAPQAGWDANEPAQRVVDAYDAAARPETKHEAVMRAAWVYFRGGRDDAGLALLDTVPGDDPDPQVRYLTALVRGQLLRASGKPDAAIAAFRSALAIWPGAQSARLALMTTLVRVGQLEEAASLAEQIETAGEGRVDPWWIYWLGDSRAYETYRAALREAAK